MKTTTQSGQAWRGYERARRVKSSVVENKYIGYKLIKRTKIMKLIVMVLVFSLLIVSGVWFYILPGFDSGTALVTALVSFVGLFVKNKVAANSFSQKITNNSFGIQAGGDVNINNSNAGKDKDKK
ncbi:hypothetical protein GSE37_20775 [Klebsiella variicola]|uniref:hypothetical protein n=1 Tax=Klebsiella variicola TaxID=244366 RepID=UPI001FA6AE4A|nr:hypothetical protein [Klebsiella variicola]MCI4426586.1 hypothetical protein [Klebsiella variicola]